jgi:streptogrisin C
LALVTAGTAIGVAGPADAAPSGGPPASDLIGYAADQMAAQWHVSPQEAARRIQEQGRVQALAGWLHDNDPSYAGVWIDQEHGGRVVVQTTARGSVRAAAQRFGLADRVDERVVPYSSRQLDGAQPEVTRRVAAAGLPAGDFTVTLDEQTDHLVVQVVGQRTGAVGEASRAVGALPGNLRAMVASTPRTGVPTQRFKDCENQDQCGRPLRGGIKIGADDANDNGFALCTSGFTGHAVSGGQPVMITAGHCGIYQSPYWYQADMVDLVWDYIGSVASINLGGTADGMTVNVIPGWNPQPWVW